MVALQTGLKSFFVRYVLDRDSWAILDPPLTCTQHFRSHFLPAQRMTFGDEAIAAEENGDLHQAPG